MPMNYVDGFVLAVPTANKEKYIDLAMKAAPIFKKHGAISVIECWGDEVPEGKLTSFPMAVQRKPDETVLFSWIVWKDKKAREIGMEKAMNDMSADMEKCKEVFDNQRMIYGGFEMIVKE
jgi:uncharacterized protein YbaA (DUF1428 family)